MSAKKRLLRFAFGGLFGTAVGTAVAVLLAPQSGQELRGKISDRLRQAKLAGVEAKAIKEAALISKFREDVDDPDALAGEETKARLEAAEHLGTLSALGLGLNAPGALAAQETMLRQAAPGSVDPAHAVATLPADVRADQAYLGGEITSTPSRMEPAEPVR